jgi:hypothetical protein
MPGGVLVTLPGPVAVTVRVCIVEVDFGVTEYSSESTAKLTSFPRGTPTDGTDNMAKRDKKNAMNFECIHSPRFAVKFPLQIRITII